MDNTFHLNRTLILRLADMYHADQISLFEAIKDDPLYKNRKPLSEEEIRKHIKELIEVSFWASLRKEEGRHHDFTLLYSPPDLTADAGDYFMFNDPLPFDPDTLAKLAPALQSTETIGV